MYDKTEQNRNKVACTGNGKLVQKFASFEFKK